jgi:hypothetical protein
VGETELEERHEPIGDVVLVYDDEVMAGFPIVFVVG